MDNHITDEQTRKLKDGGAPSIRFPKNEPCPVKIGQTIHIANNLKLVVLDVHSKKTVWRIVYRIADSRPRLLRQGAPRYNPRSTRHWRPDEEHGYTNQALLAIIDAGEAISASEQRRQTSEAKERWEHAHPKQVKQRADRRRVVKARRRRTKTSNSARK